MKASSLRQSAFVIQRRLVRDEAVGERERQCFRMGWAFKPRWKLGEQILGHLKAFVERAVSRVSIELAKPAHAKLGSRNLRNLNQFDKENISENRIA